MKNWVRFLVFAMLPLMVSSCISYKKSLVLKGEESLFLDAKVSTPETTYVLQTSDVVFIEIDRLVMGDEMYTMADHLNSQLRAQQMNPYVAGNPIKENGKLDVPLVGEVQAAGLTIDELNQSILAAAQKVYSTAAVKVFLLTQNITVMGEVPRSGRFSYYTERINIFDAVAMAGGFTDFSDRGEIKILREEGGETKVIHVDLATLTDFEGQYFYLKSNDVVLVSPQKRKRWVANNNFGAVLSSITVAVTVLSLVISLNSAK
ncbi:MAG: polysaccharide biosynthesis/export family protein [Flavobacteriales bacterium]|nr:polysaccharide biosynthesis/export family protein [Flavobacteriales bacterium]